MTAWRWSACAVVVLVGNVALVNAAPWIPARVFRPAKWLEGYREAEHEMARGLVYLRESSRVPAWLTEWTAPPDEPAPGGMRCGDRADPAPPTGFFDALTGLPVYLSNGRVYGAERRADQRAYRLGHDAAVRAAVGRGASERQGRGAVTAGAMRAAFDRDDWTWGPDPGGWGDSLGAGNRLYRCDRRELTQRVYLIFPKGAWETDARCAIDAAELPFGGPARFALLSDAVLVAHAVEEQTYWAFDLDHLCVIATTARSE